MYYRITAHIGSLRDDNVFSHVCLSVCSRDWFFQMKKFVGGSHVVMGI